MDPLVCILIFVTALWLSPFAFIIWQIFQDRKNYKAIKEARALQIGASVEVVRISQTGINYGSKPTTIPIKHNDENLILTGRSFFSVAVAKKLTTDGGPGLLWETTLGETRLGWLESQGEKYWGLLNPEYSPSRENEPQGFGGA